MFGLRQFLSDTFSSPAPAGGVSVTPKLGVESLETREVPAVIMVGDPGQTREKAYAVGPLTASLHTYGGAMETTKDVDLFRVDLKAGQGMRIRLTHDWNGKDGKDRDGLQANAQVWTALGQPVTGGGANGEIRLSRVHRDTTYYVGVTHTGNRHYRISDGSGAVAPKNADTGNYTVSFAATSRGRDEKPELPGVLKLDQPYAFTSVNFPDRTIRHRDFEVWLDQRTESDLFRGDSGFVIRPGLADPSLVSFESVNFPGRFLRHRDMRLHLDPSDASNLYRADATFRVVAGLSGQGVSFESVNFPGHFIRHQGFRLMISANDGSQLFRNDATFTAM